MIDSGSDFAIAEVENCVKRDPEPPKGDALTTQVKTKDVRKSNCAVILVASGAP